MALLRAMCGVQYPNNSIWCTEPHGHGQVVFDGQTYDHADPDEHAYWVMDRETGDIERDNTRMMAPTPEIYLDNRSDTPLLTTVHVSIGNSDDKLTQAEWSAYVRQVDDIIRDYAAEVHGQFFSTPDSRWQNASWAFVLPRSHPNEIATRVKHWLGQAARQYRQDSIAWNESVTQFITPPKEGQ